METELVAAKLLLCNNFDFEQIAQLAVQKKTESREAVYKIHRRKQKLKSNGRRDVPKALPSRVELFWEHFAIFAV